MSTEAVVSKPTAASVAFTDVGHLRRCVDVLEDRVEMRRREIEALRRRVKFLEVGGFVFIVGWALWVLR